jgi:hypothetical protein
VSKEEKGTPGLNNNSTDILLFLSMVGRSCDLRVSCDPLNLLFSSFSRILRLPPSSALPGSSVENSRPVFRNPKSADADASDVPFCDGVLSGGRACNRWKRKIHIGMTDSSGRLLPRTFAPVAHCRAVTCLTT